MRGGVYSDEERPLQNTHFCPISVLGSKFNPQNTQCIRVVKIFACLEFEQKHLFFRGLDDIRKPSCSFCRQKGRQIVNIFG